MSDSEYANERGTEVGARQSRMGGYQEADVGRTEDRGEIRRDERSTGGDMGRVEDRPESRRQEWSAGAGAAAQGGDGDESRRDQRAAGALTDDAAASDRPASRSGMTGSRDGAGHDIEAAKRGDESATQSGGLNTPSAANGSLVSDAETLRLRWESVQVGFVDDPRQAVGDADVLVSTVIEDLANGFRQQRQRLESRWSEGGEASTDDLRDSFQRYRDFFERLLRVS